MRVTKLDVGKVRFGTSLSYEFRIGMGSDNDNFTLKFADQVTTWNKFRTPFPDLPSLVHRLGSFPLLHTLKLEGPFALRVDALHNLSLSLPSFFLCNTFIASQPGRIAPLPDFTKSTNHVSEVPFFLPSLQPMQHQPQ